MYNDFLQVHKHKWETLNMVLGDNFFNITKGSMPQLSMPQPYLIFHCLQLGEKNNARQGLC